MKQRQRKLFKSFWKRICKKVMVITQILNNYDVRGYNSIEYNMKCLSSVARAELTNNQ